MFGGSRIMIDTQWNGAYCVYNYVVGHLKNEELEVHN